ncbi:UDP-N-acetylglucosamine 2-epimerase [Hoeflea sp.]|uniref:UDP-N-acetylglucosamine 2-epimerase n=1 Tax=Hoeflea sp. TaxID=1940281 RepID=UPI003A92E666
MKVLVACYGGGHVSMCVPLIEALKARGHDVVVLALTVAGPAFERLGIAHRRPIDFVDLERVRRYGERLIGRHHTDGKGLSRDESLAYLGVSLQNLSAEIGDEAAWAAYENAGLNAFCPTEFMKDVLHREAPDAVVATTSPRMEKAAMRAAHALDIPSVCMVDLFALIEFDWLKRADNGRYLTLPSDKLRQRFEAAGRDPEKLIVTGNPGFDTLGPFRNMDTGAAYRAQKGIAPEKRIIFFAEQPEPQDPDLPRRVRKHLHEVCRANSGWQLVVRLHPASSDPAKEIIPEGAVQSHGTESLHEALRAADVVITLTSTVGMEALLLDRPTMILAISPYQHFVDYSAEDGALIVPALEGAEAGIAALLSGGAEAQELAAARARLPEIGGAAERITQLLERITA